MHSNEKNFINNRVTNHYENRITYCICDNMHGAEIWGYISRKRIYIKSVTTFI